MKLQETDPCFLSLNLKNNPGWGLTGSPLLIRFLFLEAESLLWDWSCPIWTLLEVCSVEILTLFPFSIFIRLLEDWIDPEYVSGISWSSNAIGLSSVPFPPKRGGCSRAVVPPPVGSFNELSTSDRATESRVGGPCGGNNDSSGAWEVLTGFDVSPWIVGREGSLKPGRFAVRNDGNLELDDGKPDFFLLPGFDSLSKNDSDGGGEEN